MCFRVVENLWSHLGDRIVDQSQQFIVQEDGPGGENNRYVTILSFFAIDYLVTYSANIRLGASKPGVRTYS